MKDISLQQLLEAGCHFGHKSERWYPKAAQYIYTEKDGIHIIDLAKTKSGLEAALKYVRDSVADGGEIVFVATKRQAKDIVKQASITVNAPYFTERWIGGFLTNWDEIRKNVDKANRMAVEETNGDWKKFPKHEQVKLSKHLIRLRQFFGGVLTLKKAPTSLFIVDVKREIAAVREAIRTGIPIIAMVDTNSDPRGIDYVIPANDDAVGSITLIVNAITSAYAEGKKIFESREVQKNTELELQKTVKKTENKTELKSAEVAGEVILAEKNKVVEKTVKKETDKIKSDTAGVKKKSKTPKKRN
jgi:small subunit ribosomal protein S2